MIVRHNLLVIFLCLGMLAMPQLAHAGDPVADELTLQADKKQVEDEIYMEATKKTIAETTDDLKAAEGKIYRQWVEDDAAPATDYSLATAIKALPKGLAKKDVVFKTLMMNRYYELNRIPLPQKDATGQALNNDNYLVDSTWVTPSDVRYFDMYTRLFCNPEAHGGAMGKIVYPMVKDPTKATRADEDDTTKATDTDTTPKPAIRYNLTCGRVDGNNSVATLTTIYGDPKSEEAQQVMDLPLRPSDLFFSTTTFPTLPSKSKALADQSGVNPGADLYMSAFSVAMRFLFGPVPDGTTMGGQEKIERMQLATIPFAILFSENMGTMEEGAPKALARTLTNKLGNLSADSVIYERLMNIQKRNTIGISEYMDIMMYQIPMSPGYHQRITKDLSRKQLIREEVWLTAMQTALNYQRNRWLELLTALEAVR